MFNVLFFKLQFINDIQKNKKQVKLLHLPQLKMMGNDFGKLMQNTEINDETCPEMLKNLALLIQVYRKDKAG